MQIVKRLITPGSNEVNAVLLNDVTEEYPVPLQALTSKIIFEQLMASGYTYTSLPYGFVKDGVKFKDLPVETVSMTDEQLEQMYYMQGQPLSTEELKSYITEGTIDTVPTPPTNYTIHTREELMAYLESTSKVHKDGPVIPLNYFVSPAAQFTMKEYNSTEYSEYVKLITARRTMSYMSFLSTVEWLKVNAGLTDLTAQGFSDAYFAWGLDGLKFEAFDKTRSTQAEQFALNRSAPPKFYKTTIGLIDGAGGIHVSESDKKYNWKLLSLDDSARKRESAGLAPTECRAVKLKTPESRDITTLVCPEYNLVYDRNRIIFWPTSTRFVTMTASASYPTFTIKSPVDSSAYIDITEALPSQMEKMYSHMVIRSIAKDLYNSRIVRSDMNSYKVLLLQGLAPKEAVEYILTKTNLLLSAYDPDVLAREMEMVANEEKGSTSNELLHVTMEDLDSWANYPTQDYSTMNAYTRAKYEILDSVIEGALNIDMMDVAIAAESRFSLDSTYNTILAIHEVMGISPADIMEKLNTAPENAEYVVFSANGLTIKVDVSVINPRQDAFVNDMRKYTLESANKSTWFTYVTRVAREVGSEKANRHVGIEFEYVNTYNSKASKALAWLANLYEEEVNNNIANAAQRAAFLEISKIFCYTHYFEIAHRGYCTMPAELGSKQIPVPADIRNYAMLGLERYIETTVCYCQHTLFRSATDCHLDGFCVNAYITADKVIPKEGFTIHEAPFYTMWCNYGRSNPSIHNQLIQVGAFDANFVAWEMRYGEEQFEPRGLGGLNDISSLFTYYKNAVSDVAEWPRDYEFVSVTHPVEYIYPHMRVEVEPMSIANPVEPVIRLGLTRKITSKDYANEFVVNVDTQDFKGIRYFNGFNADCMISTPNIFSKIPVATDKGLMVLSRNNTICTIDNKEFLDYTRIVELMDKGYPITHVYNRTYLLRTLDGVLWEVVI